MTERMHGDDDLRRELQLADVDTLAIDVLHVSATSPVDPLSKPFGLLAAAAQVCMIAAEGSPEMRARCAMAAIEVVKALAPECVITLPPKDGQTH